MAAGARRPSRDALPGPELRLRSLRDPDPRPRPRRARSQLGAGAAERLGGRAARDDPTLRRALRAVRPRPDGRAARVRACRVHGRVVHAAARPAAAHRLGGPGDVPVFGARRAGRRGRSAGTRLRLLRPGAPRSRARGGRRRRHPGAGTPRRSGSLPRSLGHPRLLPGPRRDARDRRRRRLARHRRPRLRRRRRSLPHGTVEGRHHQGRQQSVSPGSRSRGRRRCRHPRGVRRSVRRHGSRARHGALRDRGRDAGDRAGRAGRAAARRDAQGERRGRRPSRPRRPRAAGLRLEDVERQDPAGGDPRRLAAGPNRPAASRRGGPVAAPRRGCGRHPAPRMVRTRRPPRVHRLGSSRSSRPLRRSPGRSCGSGPAAGGSIGSSAAGPGSS